MWFWKRKNQVEDSLNSLLDREHNPVNGFSEEETEVCVFVEKKLSLEEIHKKCVDIREPWRFDDIVPDEINNKPTSVIELGEVKELSRDTKKYRPLKGRAAISVKGSMETGTAGVVGYISEFNGTPLVGKLGSFHRLIKALGFDFNKRPVILTNWHVVAKNRDSSNIGVSIVQPRFGQVVGDVIWECDIDAGEIDAALVQVHDYVEANIGELVNIKKRVTGYKQVRYGMEVLKSGYRTRTTEGKCFGTNAYVNIKFKHKTIRFKGCKIFRPTEEFEDFSASGDSGSLVVEKSTGDAVALIFAGNSKYSIACDIEKVMEQTGLQF